jgi:hypothetical protein
MYHWITFSREDAEVAVIAYNRMRRKGSEWCRLPVGDELLDGIERQLHDLGRLGLACQLHSHTGARSD